MGITAFFSFLIFKYQYEEQRIKKVSDRGSVFLTLVIGLIGSLTLIDYRPGNANPVMILIGFSLLASSFVIGKRAVINMYAKLVGSSSHFSYYTISLVVLFLIRISATWWNIIAVQ